jgi:hypothetical protein
MLWGMQLDPAIQLLLPPNQLQGDTYDLRLWHAARPWNCALEATALQQLTWKPLSSIALLPGIQRVWGTCTHHQLAKVQTQNAHNDTFKAASLGSMHAS